MSSLSHRTKRQTLEPRISLGALTSIIVAVATLSGYLVAFNWRSGEAAFFGIPTELMSVSLEDTLRFAVPMVMAFSCLVVVAIIDDAIKKKRSGRKTIALFSIAVALCALTLTGLANVASLNIFTSLLVVGCVVFFVITFLYSLYTRWESVLVSGFVLIELTTLCVSDLPTVPVVVLFASTLVLLLYVARMRRYFPYKGLPNWIIRTRLPYHALAVGIVVALLCILSFFGGNRMAQTRERIVLSESDQGREVVLATYSGDRSILGLVWADGTIASYRVVSLADESDWHIEPVHIEGATYIPISI